MRLYEVRRTVVRDLLHADNCDPVAHTEEDLNIFLNSPSYSVLPSISVTPTVCSSHHQNNFHYFAQPLSILSSNGTIDKEQSKYCNLNAVANWKKASSTEQLLQSKQSWAYKGIQHQGSYDL